MPRIRILSLFCLTLCCAAHSLAAQPAAIPAPPRYSPIPVDAIYAPVQPNGTADDALASGKVERTVFPMAAKASKVWRIAFLFPHVKDPYWVACSSALISEARRLGVAIDILPATGYDDLAGQLQLMDEAIAAHYDAIVVSPIGMTANNASIAKARAAGIPVFELANDSRSDDLTIKITTSLREMGRQATRWVLDDARKRGLKTVNLALLPGPLGAGWVKGEVDGTRYAAQVADLEVNIIDIRYGDSDAGEQAELASQMLARYGNKIDYLIGCTGCAPAAVAPLKAAGLAGKIKLVAFDLTNEIAEAIRLGDIAAAADTRAVSQARVAINAAVNVLEKRQTRLPHTLLIQLGMVDQQNFSRYPFDSSIAPENYKLQLKYDPNKS
ncbi:TMAO reductase system periplasmic protein TorT [Pseudoduganella danionis]|uniref:TMAO reductase system periplasmic protein TorT n=1 Tax=Pseudoduganella danionis TaxID=1890295 RepID=A0ABW9SKJ5_9BURK|nr:TMAO reductase system periplasmic protein TorT [Pseudoduganella danionis]MTW32678.1 TMAO reductase system periplasmic protein TorT [Pseudoduganella danionis]